MNSLEATRELVTEIAGILTAAGLETVHVTADALTIPAALASRPVVLVQPPKINHTTYTYSVATWEVVVMAGPPHDLMAAWEKIVPINAALRVPLSVDSEEPSAFAHPSMPDHPAYALGFDTAL